MAGYRKEGLMASVSLLTMNMLRLRMIGMVFLLFAGVGPSSSAPAAEPVVITVYAGDTSHTYRPVWNYFGADEPNYVYAGNGEKLLHELAALSPVPVYFRAHNLLTTGTGEASLKWGSTNVYTELPGGSPVYDWTITDRIFDALRRNGVRPLVEVGFMPEALSTHPRPYRHDFPRGDIFTGWSYPPSDYDKWQALITAWVQHLHERYGEGVKDWLWEVWNEPDIPYWHGTPEEYNRLYDVTAAAIRHVLPSARIGGPETTRPSSAGAGAFLSQFLEHCARGRNAATGGIGAPLDFISFHPKGSPKSVDGHVRMGLATQLLAVDRGMQIVASFPEWRSTPIILGESDPEGCAACQGAQNGYRNGPLYGVTIAEATARTYELARGHGVNLMGIVTWAFEFEDQPYFAGFRELATNGVDKPVLNAFRMLGLLGNERVKATSSNGLATEDVVRSGVRTQADINAIATRKDREIEILVWNYHDDDIPFPPAPIDLVITGLPATARRGLLEHFRMDAGYSNAFTTWKDMGSPQSLSAGEYERLQLAGQLQLLNSPAWIPIQHGAVQQQFLLPRQGISLVRLAW